MIEISFAGDLVPLSWDMFPEEEALRKEFNCRSRLDDAALALRFGMPLEYVQAQRTLFHRDRNIRTHKEVGHGREMARDAAA